MSKRLARKPAAGSLPGAGRGRSSADWLPTPVAGVFSGAALLGVAGNSDATAGRLTSVEAASTLVAVLPAVGWSLPDRPRALTVPAGVVKPLGRTAAGGLRGAAATVVTITSERFIPGVIAAARS